MTTVKPINTDAYISGFQNDIQILLEQVRSAINNAAPDTVEKISYGMPAFQLNGASIWFAAYKNYIGLYPKYGMEELEDEMAAYRGKEIRDFLHFRYGQPIPLELITKIVKLKFRKK